MAVATTNPRRTARPPPGGPWRSRRSRWDLKFSPYAFVAPFFVLFAAFGLYPLIWTAWISVHHTELINARPDRCLGRLPELHQPAARLVLLERARATP